MNSDPQNFESLRRLLALKRHEQPPPGYFDNFSRQVTARLRAGEPQTFSQQFSDVPWVQRLISILGGRPAFAGAFGAAICALLVSGIVYSEKMEGSPIATNPVADGSDSTALVTPTAMAVNQSVSPDAMLVSNTNPASSSRGSLFDQIPVPMVQTVSFSR